MSSTEQQLLEPDARADGSPLTGAAQLATAGEQELAVRDSLRTQIARLERELSAMVAEAFPFQRAPSRGTAATGGPCLPSLAQLERTRDELAGRLQQLRRAGAARAERQRRARERLERMRLEPGRYKFVRLPVSELGESGCGVWEVRPRLGLIGMLAGWWQLKLSSGCPLATGTRASRVPARHSAASAPGSGADARSWSRSSSSRTSEAAPEICGSGSGPSGAGS